MIMRNPLYHTLTRWLLAALLLPLLSLPAHAQIIDVVGSTTVRALMEPAVDAYRRLHPEVIIHVGGGGSGVGAAAMLDGRASIGMMSREPDADEAARLKQQGIARVRIAYDAVAVVISDALYHHGGVHALKIADIAAIYRGAIRNWQAVGGPDRRILVIDRVTHSGTHQTFVDHLLGGGAITPDAVIVESNRDSKTLLIASDQAIAYLPFGAIDDDRIHAVALLQGDKSFIADNNSVLDGSYPLRRSLYLLYKTDAPAYVHDFIHYLSSPAAAPIIRQAGYLPAEKKQQSSH